MEEKRLFLLDAYALIYRAYYALLRAPRVTSKGMNTSAIFGFCNTLDEILRKENPTHIAVCFDPSGPTFRHEEYPEYKAQRDKQPEDITIAVPYIKRILDAYRIPALEVNGYEADDVIGTLSRMAEQEGFTTYMMTPDKDYGQLVTDRVLMYRPALRGEGFEVRGPQQVCERYGIERPSQVIDLLALEGDTSDNIPGCPGVGEKTAAKLIGEFGSVDNLLANTDKLKGALKKKVEENIEQIRFSKRLVTICTDVPLGELKIDDLVRRPLNVEQLIEVYRELEFRTFIRRLTEPEAAPANTTPTAAPKGGNPAQASLFDEPAADDGGLFGMMNTATGNDLLSNLSNYPHEFIITDSPDKIKMAVDEALTGNSVAISIAAEGSESPMTATVIGLAIATSEHKAYYISIPLNATKRQEVTLLLQPLLEQSSVTIAAGDVKNASLLLRRIGLDFKAPYMDCSVAHYLIDPEMKHTLPLLAARFLDYTMLDIPAPRGSKRSPALTMEQACEAATTVVRLIPKLMEKIAELEMTSLLTEIELPLIKVLAEMEWAGVRVDIDELKALSKSYSERLEKMEQEAYQLAGGAFNVSSPMQVGEVLFDRLKIDPSAKRTKTGAYSTTEEILAKYRSHHRIVDLILDIRGLKKLLSTYIDSLPELVNPTTGRIHTTFNQTVTATGRLSSTNPNLQNIPVRTDDGKEVRRAFIASPGNLILSADYSQIELRLMADFSADSAMLEAFHSGYDFHRATAAKVYHEPIESVTDEQRSAAKSANFGIIYGISAFGLSEQLEISRSEAKELISNYFLTYPGVKEYMERSIEQARRLGYVSTVMGRRRLLPDINSRNAVVRSFAERNAINAPLQGSAADIIKIAMVRISEEMKSRNMKSLMIMQVHDELVFDVVPEELDQLREIVERCMSGAYSGKVTLEVSAGTGNNWLEAH